MPLPSTKAAATPAKPSRGLVVAAFAAVYIVWGSTFLGMRFATETIPPLLMAGARYFLAGGFLYGLMRGRGAPGPTWREWRTASVVGALLLLFGNGGATVSVQYIPSSLTALLVATVPMFMTLFAWWGGMSRRPSAPVWLGLLIGFAGVYLLIRPSPGSFHHDLASRNKGMAIAVVASAIWAVGSLYSRKAKGSSSAFLDVAMQMTAGGGWMLLAGAATGELRGFHLSSVSAHSLWAFAYLVSFGSLLAFTAYIWLLRVCDPAQVATYAFVNPVVAVLLGWGLGGEKLSGETFGAAALIVVAVAVIILFQARKVPAVVPVVE